MDIRIHIIGGAGSGKSYLAANLSKKYNIPHLDLDSIFWDNTSHQYGIKAPVDVRDNKLKKFIQQPAWIVEGVYFEWLEPSFELADKILILNTPIQIQEERIWSRYEKRKLEDLPQAKKETIKSIENLIEWNKKYNNEYLSNFIKNTKHTYKIVCLDSNNDIVDLID